MATCASAQAPSSAQVWDVRFVVDSAGAFAAGPAATAVGITIMARVGILPNTSPSGTSNFGVSRVGGTGFVDGGFRVWFSDRASAEVGDNEGRLARGATGDARTLDPVTGAWSPTGVPTLLRDTRGEPLAGHFAAFRGSFDPQVGPLFLGSNADARNGALTNPVTGPLLFANIVGSRSLNFASEGSGPLGVCAVPTDGNPANLVGDLIPVYRLMFLPSAGLQRQISASVLGLSARYLFTLEQTTAISNYVFTNSGFAFTVPAPDAAVLAGATAGAWSRRRRSARGTSA